MGRGLAGQVEPPGGRASHQGYGLRGSAGLCPAAPRESLRRVGQEYDDLQARPAPKPKIRKAPGAKGTKAAAQNQLAAAKDKSKTATPKKKPSAPTAARQAGNG